MMRPFEGNREELGRLIERKQRSLVPLNIAVMIICLVAAVSLLFAPLVSIDMGAMSEAMASMQGEDESDGQADAQSEAFARIGEVFGNISVNIFTLANFAVQPDLTAAIGNYAGDLLSEAGDKLVTEVALPAIVEQIQSQGTEIPEIEDAAAILDKFGALGEGDDVDADIAGLAAEVQKQLGKEVLPDESVPDFSRAVRSLYDTTVENNGGEFTVEACICVAASQGLAGGGEDYTVYTSYGELAGALAEQTLNGGGEADEMLSTLSVVLKAVAFAMLFFVAVWLILFIFALAHTFTKNKRFVMWYVKLFGAWPCLIFFIAPLIASAVLPGLTDGAVTAAAAMLGVISSMTWISGICYLLLWAVSIFWAFPIKRKIRYYNRQYAAMN